MRLMEVVTFIMAGFGFLIMITGVGGANGAPQEAAAAAVGLGVAVIPYAVTATLQRRAILQELKRERTA